MKSFFNILTVTVLIGVHASMACSVCGGPLTPRTLNAYILMTMLLSLFPFLLLGTGLWVYLKSATPVHQGKDVEAVTKGMTGL